MNQFFRDMWDVLRLRYRPFETYQYPAWVYALILLLCGVSTAAVMHMGFSAQPEYPLKFSSSVGLVVFCVCMVVCQWWSLGYFVSKILKYYGAGDVPMWGYMLLTQAFTMFAVLFLYLPDAFVIVASFWGMWTLWIQLYGLFLVAGREVSGWRVMLSYVVAYLGYCLLMLVVGCVFLVLGVVESPELNKEMQRIMQEQQQLQQPAK